MVVYRDLTQPNLWKRPPALIDAVLMHSTWADYHLADGETGTEVISAVRNPLGPDLPAILITGDTSSAMRELSCDAHLRTPSKPINPDELLRLFGELLE